MKKILSLTLCFFCLLSILNFSACASKEDELLFEIIVENLELFEKPSTVRIHSGKIIKNDKEVFSAWIILSYSNISENKATEMYGVFTAAYVFEEKTKYLFDQTRYANSFENVVFLFVNNEFNVENINKKLEKYCKNYE
jgi:hypothetical protein